MTTARRRHDFSYPASFPRNRGALYERRLVGEPWTGETTTAYSMRRRCGGKAVLALQRGEAPTITSKDAPWTEYRKAPSP